jgi:F-type H+-transporting ATPase subunit delta
MTGRAVAIRYARALFDVAIKEQLDLDRVERELAGFADLVKANASLARVLSNPAIPVSRKRAVVQQLLALSPVIAPVGRLLVLLADRDRLGLVHDVTQAFAERVMEHRHVIRAELTTAVALPADRVAALHQGIARATGRQVQLETRVDPSIIGGAITRIGSTVYDGSVTTQLQKLKQQLAQTER